MFRNFFFTTLILLFSAGILWVTVSELDPFGPQKNVALVTFFFSLFLFVATFCTFVFFFASELFSGRRLGSRKFLVSLRRGIFVAVYFTTYMVLEWLNFWGVLEGVLLAVFLILVEWGLGTRK